MRKLASVQRIDKLESIPGADFIEKASILGWNVVVKKGEFKEGDLCIYFEIDSLLPQIPEFDFINKHEVRKAKCNDCNNLSVISKIQNTCPACESKNIEVFTMIDWKGDSSRQLTTKRMKGVISQGLAYPVSKLLKESIELGQDVTGALNVTKYEPVQPMNQGGNIRGKFPFYVPKTDETRLQSIPEVIKEIVGVPCYITVKCDGTSSTFSFKDGDINVCSRNQSYKDSVAEGLPDTKDYYWHIAKKYEIPQKLEKYGRNIALQGEICGPGIQKNRLGLKNFDLFLFDVYLIDDQKYADLALLKELAAYFSIPMVPILNDNFIPEWNMSVNSFLELAEGKYTGTRNEREGIVVRPIEYRKSAVVETGRLSFKVISNKFLLGQ